MPELKDIRNIYFIGIGGIGMSAIARYFLAKGVTVSGYDKAETVLTRQLALEGARVHYTDDISLLDPEADIVVYTPAIPAGHLEMAWYHQHQVPVVKRSDILSIITANSFNICVAGTHGKTSISTMIGHLLRHSGYGGHVFLGGISVNYNTNYWSSEGNTCVVEADEYDRSFLKLSPDIAIITSMDADHLDIYGTVEAMREAFVQFAERIRPGGLLIRKQGLDELDRLQGAPQQTYALSAEPGEAMSDITAHHLLAVDGGYLFDAYVQGHSIPGIRLQVGGLHNVENMLAAIGVCVRLGIADHKIREAVAAYKGVKRRFEYLLNTTRASGDRLIMIDDYAHHPEELRALIQSARQLFPEEWCTIIFQPHLFSRTRDHARAFAEVLSLADEVLLLPVYPARELPMEGVTSALIAQYMHSDKVRLTTKEAWLQDLREFGGGLLLTAGAGDIDTLLPEAVNILNQQPG